MKLKFIQRDTKTLKDFSGLKIWQQPKNLGVYAIGVDTAEGVGKDASCAQVIECKSGQHVASFWSNTIDVDNFAAEMVKLGYYYNKAYLCIEINNHGNAMVALIAGGIGGLNYPNLYKRQTFDEYTQKKTKQVGFKTTSATKPRIIENLKAALRDGDTQTYDKYTILELTNFTRDERTGRMAASGNAKDDRVMAYALAWEQARMLKENMEYTDKYTDSFHQSYDPMTGFPLFG